MISVIIPTCNRPEYLRQALKSVAGQTEFGKIDVVLVSDNGTDRAKTEVICDSFEAEYRMNIGYIHRGFMVDGIPSKSMSPLEHGRQIWREHKEHCTSQYTAILHDDDWWQPQHLEIALSALGQRKNPAFYGCAQFSVLGEASTLHCTSSLYAWVAANFPPLDRFWLLDEPAMLVASVMGGISHYSSMVCNTENLKKSTHIFEEPGCDFDNDRRVQFELSRHGEVIHNPLPQIFVREHMGRDCVVNFKREERIGLFAETTDWIVKRSGVSKQTIIGMLEERWGDCPTLSRFQVKDAMESEWCLPVLHKEAKA